MIISTCQPQDVPPNKTLSTSGSGLAHVAAPKLKALVVILSKIKVQHPNFSASGYNKGYEKSQWFSKQLFVYIHLVDILLLVSFRFFSGKARFFLPFSVDIYFYQDHFSSTTYCSWRLFRCLSYGIKEKFWEEVSCTGPWNEYDRTIWFGGTYFLSSLLSGWSWSSCILGYRYIFH